MNAYRLAEIALNHFFAHRCEPPPASAIRRIAVFRNNDLGDVVVSTPLYRALRRALPGAEIHVCIGSWAKPILALNPNIDRLLLYDIPWGNKQLHHQLSLRRTLGFLAGSPLTGELRRESYDLGIDYAGNFFTSFLMWQARIRWRIGISGYQGGGAFCNQVLLHSAERHVAATGLELLRLLGIEAEDTRLELYLSYQDRENLSARLGKLGISSDVPLLVLSPGSGWPPYKRWLPEYFAATADLFQERLGLLPIVTGTLGEKDLAAKVCAHMRSSGVNLGGELTLGEFMALVARARLVISNSNASPHIAQAFGVPAVAIVGGTEGGVTAHGKAWGYRDNYCILGTNDRDCRMLCGPYCPTQECMRAITPKQVLEAGLRLLEAKSQESLGHNHVARA